MPTTSKPFSTISYNTIPFLKKKLNRFVEEKVLSDWAFIYHYKEEGDSSDHIHLYCRPRNRIDIDSFFDEFVEPDPNNVLPFRCIQSAPCKSKDGYIDDWVLYTLHEPRYCAKKMLDKKYTYDYHCYEFCNELQFRELYRHAMFESDIMADQKRLEYINSDDVKKSELIHSGVLPITYSNNLLALKRLEVLESFSPEKARSMMQKQMLTDFLSSQLIASERKKRYNDDAMDSSASNESESGLN